MATSSPNLRSPLPPLLLGISLKMYLDLPATTTYLKSLLALLPPSTSKSSTPLLFVIPSFPALPACSALLSESPPNTPKIFLGAQNCHWEDSGAHTGEVSPKVLKQVGCSLVELGHAERRRSPFHESDDMVALKAKAAVRNGLIPLVCIGEKSQSSILSEGVGLAIRECRPQISAVLEAVSQDADVIFAYEPVWAIGADEPAGKDHVLAVVGELRKGIVESHPRKGEVRILYGGSAGVGTWGVLGGSGSGGKGVDGLFLGRFGQDVRNFRQVLEEMDGG